MVAGSQASGSVRADSASQIGVVLAGGDSGKKRVGSGRPRLTARGSSLPVCPPVGSMHPGRLGKAGHHLVDTGYAVLPPAGYEGRPRGSCRRKGCLA